VVIALLVAGTCVVGFMIHRLVVVRGDRSQARVDAEGLPVAEILLPARLIIPLLLAFVLAQTYGSFSTAGSAAAEEASAVYSEAQIAQLVPGQASRDLTDALRCYAHVVATDEWTSMADHRKASPAADRASGLVQLALGAVAAKSGESIALSSLLAGEGQRVEARRARIAKADHSLPGEITLLMTFGVLFLLGTHVALAHPAVRFRTTLAVMGATAVIFGMVLFIIADLDQPYGGHARVGPQAMRTTEHRIAQLTPGALRPCPD
jgi:hypothetical protein